MTAAFLKNGIGLRPNHPVSRVAALSWSGTDAATLVCAGGSCVSVQAAPRWQNSSLAGVSSAEILKGLSRHPHAAEPAGVAVAETGKGAGALLAAVQQWSCAHSMSSSTDMLSGGEAAPEAAMTPEQRVTLDAGSVTCLTTATLPGNTDSAVAVVGTTVGSVALLFVEGSRSLYKVAECPLLEWSRNAITAQDAIVDVAFSFDPAGRPELVSVASAACVVAMDVRLFLQSSPSSDEREPEEEEEDAKGAHAGGHIDLSRGRGHQESSNTWSTSALRAKAMEALDVSRAPRGSGTCNDPFTCFFAEASVVRLLAPQRMQAAMALDVALVMVLSDGAVHYIERVVKGGAVQLLADHDRRHAHQQQQRPPRGGGSCSTLPASPAMRVAWDAMRCHGQGEGAGEEGTAASSAAFTFDRRTIPHVLYRYRLSPHHIRTVVASASSSSATLVNDACLQFSEKEAVFHLLLVGTQRVPVSAAGFARQYYAPALQASHSAPAGWTLSHVRQQQQQQPLASNSAVGYQTLGWWAIARNVVLPQHTFDREALERQVVERHQERVYREQQEHALDVPSLLAPPVLDTNGRSSFTVQVQSSTMALPGTSASLPSSASAMVSPTSSSPATGTVSIAGSPTAAVGSGAGYGFAAVSTLLPGVLVLAAGPSLYIGDVREASLETTSLPVLRPWCTLGNTVEGLACGLYKDTRSVWVATGTAVVPVTLA